MKLTHLNALRAFEAVMRTGTFRSAADELGVTTAAVGQQIRGLEAYLGRNLFRRTASGVLPNEDALRVKSRLTSGFSIIDEVLTELRDRGAANRIAVTLPESFAENWFIRRVPDFYHQNSAVDLRLNASNRRIDLAAEGFDFAIRYCPLPEKGLDAVDLFGDYVVPVCTPAFADRYRLSEGDRSLSGIPLVHLENRTPDPEWANWESWSGVFDIEIDPPEGVVRFSKISSGLQAALTGQGLVLCGIAEAYDAIMSGALEIPFGPAKHVPTGYLYRLVSVSGRPKSLLQRQFQEWVVDTAGAFAESVSGLLQHDPQR